MTSLSTDRLARVVESNPSLRRLTSAILRQTGYQVHESRTEQDPHVEEEYEGPLELLVVGMNLDGGRSGIQIAKKIWQRNPTVRIIVTGTTRPDDEDMRTVRDARMTFLSLPYSFGRLSRAASDQPVGPMVSEAH